MLQLKKQKSKKNKIKKLKQKKMRFWIYNRKIDARKSKDYYSVRIRAKNL